MTLMEKFATLTPEQREQFAAVKDAAALDAFASEHSIEMTDEEKSQTLEYIQTGVLPLGDDELDAAAGGGRGLITTEMAEQNAKENAQREGRSVYIAENSNNFCKCSNAFKYARHETFNIGGKIYIDTKCYKCNQEWLGSRYNHVTGSSSGRVILD